MKKFWSLIIMAVLVIIGVILQLTHSNMFSAGDFVCDYFAAGDYAMGVFAAGKFSVGIFSIGIFSIGIFSISIFSIGIWSTGIFMWAVKKQIPCIFKQDCENPEEQNK